MKKINRTIITAKIGFATKPSEYSAHVENPNLFFSTEDGERYDNFVKPLRKGSTYYLLIDVDSNKMIDAININDSTAETIKAKWEAVINNDNDPPKTTESKAENLIENFGVIASEIEEFKNHFWIGSEVYHIEKEKNAEVVGHKIFGNKPEDFFIEVELYDGTVTFWNLMFTELA